MRVEALARLLSLGRRYPPFWLYPSVSLVAGLVLGTILSRFHDVDGGVVSSVVYEGGAEAAIDVERAPWDAERIDAEFVLLGRALDRDALSHRWHPL